MISGHSRHRSKVDALHQIHSLHVHAPGTTFKTKRKIYTVNVYTTQLHVKRQIHLHNIAIMAPGRTQIICQILPFCTMFNSKMAPTHWGTGTARWTPRSPAVLIVGLQGFDDFVGSALKLAVPQINCKLPPKKIASFCMACQAQICRNKRYHDQVEATPPRPRSACSCTWPNV